VIGRQRRKAATESIVSNEMPRCTTSPSKPLNSDVTPLFRRRSPLFVRAMEIELQPCFMQQLN